jgi:hypothetical protein
MAVRIHEDGAIEGTPEECAQYVNEQMATDLFLTGGEQRAKEIELDRAFPVPGVPAPASYRPEFDPSGDRRHWLLAQCRPTWSSGKPEPSSKNELTRLRLTQRNDDGTLQIERICRTRSSSRPNR